MSPVAAARVILGRQDGQVELWEPDAIRPVWTTRLEGEVRAVAFSPDGKLVAAAGDDRQIVLRAVAEPNRPIMARQRAPTISR